MSLLLGKLKGFLLSSPLEALILCLSVNQLFQFQSLKTLQTSKVNHSSHNLSLFNVA